MRQVSIVDGTALEIGIAGATMIFVVATNNVGFYQDILPDDDCIYNETGCMEVDMGQVSFNRILYRLTGRYLYMSRSPSHLTCLSFHLVTLWLLAFITYTLLLQLSSTNNAGQMGIISHGHAAVWRVHNPYF